MTSKAALRRAVALLPDAGRLTLAARLSLLVSADAAAPDDARALLASYLFDPTGAAIVATDDDHARWLDGPLFVWVGPANAAPIIDVVAALISGPALANESVLLPLLAKFRFAPRSDDAIAIAVAAMPVDAQRSMLEQLASDPGPDAALLGLSTVQCGRVLAWSPHLLDTPIAESIVNALLALLEPARPRPLLDLVAAALGPIAAQPGPLAERVREAALAALETRAAPPASFAAEIAAIGRTRAIPDEDRMMSMPRREAAEAAAYILGFAAPIDRNAFVAHRALVLDRPDGEDLLEPFVDGLVAGAHVPAVAELALALLADGGERATTALTLAARLPLDPIAEVLVAELDSPSSAHRALACAAVELLGDAGEDVERTLVARLGDPEPEVCAAATRSLVARDRRDLLGKRSAIEAYPVRRAIVLAGLGELDVPVIGELARGVLADLDATPSDVSPITYLIADSLLGSIDGLETAANLIGGVPEAAGLLALAALPGTERDVAVLAPSDVRAHLANVTLRIASDPGGGELGALALFLLARVSAGDVAIAERVAAALEQPDGYGANLIAALGELRVATDRTAAALAPLLTEDQPIGARILAAAVAGRVLPRDHVAWVDVRELLARGTVARAAAWCALRDRARRSVI